MSDDRLLYGSVKITSGQAVSAALGLSGKALVGIEMPAGWDAANLTFQGANESDGTFKNIYDAAGGEVTVVAAASRLIMLNPSSFAGFRFIKVRSGTSGTPVNQTADRTLRVLAREV